MARNVEIKAQLANLQTQVDLATELCGGTSEHIHQVDTFFRCIAGRLKLRCFDDGHGQLIHYHRDDVSGPKVSDYIISATNEPDTLHEALARAFGIEAVVEKDRYLFLHGRTRIHLDRVRDLGDYLELEVVLKDGEDQAPGAAEAEELMRCLEVRRTDLVEGAYVDLLAAKQAARQI